MLTAVAGFVDAVAYTRVTGVFPANQSGNLILLGLVVGGTPGAPAARTAGAIAAFAVGVVVAARVSGRLARGRDPGLLAAQLVLLGSAALLCRDLRVEHVSSTVEGVRGTAALVALGWPWGCSRDHQPGGRGGREHHLRDGGLTRAAEQLGRPGATDTRVVTVLALGVATYVGGAAAEASIAAHWARPLTVPVAVLAALVLVHALRSRSAPG